MRKDLNFEKSRGNTHRRMAADCTAIYRLLSERGRISIDDLASERHMSKASAYRWVTAFSSEFPIYLEDGMIVLENSATF